MMTRKGWGLLAGFAALLVIGIALLLPRLPQLLENRIRSELEVFGVQGINLGKPFWGLTGAGTNTLTFSGQYDHWQYRIAIHSLQADYHWRTLLNGEIHSLSIGTLSGTVKQISNTAENNAQAIDLASIIANVEKLELPIARIEISHLAFAVQFDQGAANLAGKDFTLDSADKSLNGDFTLQAHLPNIGELPKTHLSTEKGEHPWIPTLGFAIGDDKEPFLRGRISLSPDTTPGHQQLKLIAALKHNDLQQLFPADSLPGILNGEQSALAATANIHAEIVIPGQVPPSLHGVTLGGNLDAALSINNSAELGLTDLHSQLKIGFHGTPEAIAIKLLEPLVFSTQLESSKWPEISTAFTWQETVATNINLASEHAIEIGFGSHPSVAGKNLALNLDIGEGSNSANARLNITDFSWQQELAVAGEGTLTLPFKGKPLPTISLQGSLGGNEAMAFMGTFAISDWQLSGTLSGKRDAQALSAKSHINLDSLPLLAKEISRLGLDPGEIALASGKGTLDLAATAPTSTHKQGEQRFTFAASNLSGLAKGIAFEDLNLSGTIANSSNWHSTKPLTIAVKTLGVGVPVRNISARLNLLKSTSFTQSHWQLSALTGEFFSGTFALKSQANIDFPPTGNRFTLLLSNLQLEEILRLYEAQGVSGRGVISGEIPVILESGGLHIDNGNLQSLGGGNIAFASDKSAAMGSTNPQLAMTLRLLEDFRYDSLGIEANFAPSGQLQLGVQLSGRNPAEFDGRQINFNINVEENMYDLYKVLSLSDEMTKKIENRLQKNRR